MEVSFEPWRRGGSMADEASQVLLGSGLTVLSQPLMYVKVLVQVRACRGRRGSAVAQRSGTGDFGGWHGERARGGGRGDRPCSPAAGGVRTAAAHPGQEHLRPPGLPASRPLRLR